MRFRDGLLFVILGVALGATSCIAVDFWHDRDISLRLADALGQLDESRLALDGARDRSAGLERGLYEARTVADASAKSVGLALQSANGIADRGQRIVALVGAIKQVVADLKRISEAGSLIQPP